MYQIQETARAICTDNSEGQFWGAVRKVNLNGQFVRAVCTDSWYGQFAILFVDDCRYFMASFRPTFDY